MARSRRRRRVALQSAKPAEADPPRNALHRLAEIGPVWITAIGTLLAAIVAVIGLLLTQSGGGQSITGSSTSTGPGRSALAPAIPAYKVDVDSGNWIVPTKPSDAGAACAKLPKGRIATITSAFVTLAGRQSVVLGQPKLVIDRFAQTPVSGFYLGCGGGAAEEPDYQIDLDYPQRTKFFVNTQPQRLPPLLTLKPGENFGIWIEGLTRHHVFWHVVLPVFSSSDPNKSLGELRVPKAGSYETTGIGAVRDCTPVNMVAC